MKVLITAAASRLSRELAESLAAGHEVVLTDVKPVPTDMRFVQSELGHDDSTNELVRGIDAIVHSGEPYPDSSVSDQLDYAMRRTYNLMRAAAEERVRRLVFLSSLRLLDKYDEEFAVTENWRPLPDTSLPSLCFYLGEFLCKEFARERKIEIVCLRLGELTSEHTAEPSSSALYMDDAARAVEMALNADVPEFSLFHIQSDVPNARYLTTTRSARAFGYEPVERA